MERTQLSAIVLDLLEKETGETYDTLEDSTTLSEGLGLDSLDMAGLILHIESHFGIQIETELLDKINNVGQKGIRNRTNIFLSLSLYHPMGALLVCHSSRHV